MIRAAGRLLSPNVRRAFTLIELLVTIAIISMLAGMLMVAMSAAAESAKDAKTRAMIVKINTLIMRKYEAYRTRRVPIQIPTLAPGTPRQVKATAKMRLDGLRQLMRMELPDRWSDVTDAPIATIDPQTGGSVSMARPAISQAFLNRYNTLNNANSANPTTQNQGAECLYMIVTMGTGDDDVRSQFSEGDIGDTDSDGAPEFLDGWGRPISFLRWAPGFVSELQNGTDPDPFDPNRAYPDTYLVPPTYKVTSTQPQPTFALFPLIYSAGPDKIYDIQTDAVGTPFKYSSNNNNPFSSSPIFGTPTDLPDQTGQANGTLDHYDNIHNHLMQTK